MPIYCPEKSGALKGVLEETWRDFIEAGEVYLAEHRSETYPEDGDACPYCLQDLGAAAIALVQKYRTFCRSDLQDAITEARTALDDLIRDVQPSLPTYVRHGARKELE